MVDFAAIAEALAPSHLSVRGAFSFGEDEAPILPDGRTFGTVVLLGNVGAAYWPVFEAWRQENQVDNPLDSWTRAIVSPLAERLGAGAVFPSDRPYLPFQQWAMRAERTRPSPLGILMHPEFGLWHAYRAALLFDGLIDGPEIHASIHLCDACDGKPCLKHCPVDAHSEGGFAYGDCLHHVRSDAGAACRRHGCFDRNACPYGTDYRYPAEVQAFHMSAFAAPKT